MQPAQPSHQQPSPALHQTTAVPAQTHQVTPVSAQGWQIAQHPPSFFFFNENKLTPEGQKLIQGFETDRDAIQLEADKKVDARREALVKELQALQDQYAKAGKLDEAIAIRDYLKAGGPDKPVWIRRQR